MDNLFINKSGKSFEKVDPTEEKGSSSVVNVHTSEKKLSQADKKTEEIKDYEMTQGCVSERVTGYLQQLYKWNVGKGEGLPNNPVEVKERTTAKELIEEQQEEKELNQEVNNENT